MKSCKKCNENKDLVHFAKVKANKDGHTGVCKLCIKERHREWAEKNSEKLKKAHKDWKKNNLETRREYERLWRENNDQYSQEWRSQNKDRVKIYNKKHYNKNKEVVIKQQQQYVSNRRKTDVGFKLLTNLRSRLHMALKNNQKSGSAVKDLGCSIESLKKHLESQFQEGMSWDNYGKWHIDHIKPLSKFDLSNRVELLKACNYSNLQPLWAEDNLKKSNK